MANPNSLVIFLFLISHTLIKINAQVLNPPYFNIAEGRKINASSTCGEGQRDLYCRLVGSNFGYEQVAQGRLIMGQSCDWCDSSDPAKSHKAEYITDGTDRWWQSPPLSRDLKYAQVNITLDLGQEFHIAYVLLKMGNSPRPDVWILERSNDFGKTFQPWMYFAPTKDDCVKFFGNESLAPITRDDSVICETKFSKIVPLENGEITVLLVTDRPGALNFSMSSTLQDWSKATNIRLRLLRPQTTLEDIIEGTRRDKTVTRRYFYSIQDMNIGGRCVCNGHANSCSILDPQQPFKLFCSCKHNTCGPQCNMCCPGHEQKKWKPATADDHFQCEKCQCFGHSDQCTYVEQIDIEKKSIDIHGNYNGGGVCRDCKHNTAGINCNECIDGYYRRPDTPLNSTEICAKCECNEMYHTGNCEAETGVCECKKNYNSPNCDSCAFGYVEFPKCRPCDCYRNGTLSEQCESVKKPKKPDTINLDVKSTEAMTADIKFGDLINPSTNVIEDESEVSCPCKENFAGSDCRKCAPKFYDFPNCTSCECELQGSVDGICDEKTGKCNCKNNYDGVRCEKCRPGYFDYPTCALCNCDPSGTTNQICDLKSGKCLCKEGFDGARCDQCAPEWFGYPNCQPCNCYEKGSLYSLCSPKTGKCSCLSNYDSRTCNKCKPGYFNESNSCVTCNCDIHGSLGLACNAAGKCNCKENYDGDKCDRCRKNYHVYPFCERCECNLNGIKDNFNGCNQFSTIEKLCDCKDRVTGRKCDQCKSLYWNLNKYNPLACQECQCLTTGTLSGLGVCHSQTGQCVCKNNIIGRVCNDCRDGHYKMEEGNHFGCAACECNPGGSEHPFCLKQSGKCSCKNRITGRQCDKPIKSHYFPSFYQFIYEMEDAITPQGTQARYDYSEEVFPNFSWKGYANYSDIQKELHLDVQIDQPSTYRPVINYINSGNETINAQLTLSPLSQSNSQESPQTIQISLDPTNGQPKKHLQPIKIGIQAFLLLKQGKWRMQLKLDKPALVDYLVLLPEDYWNAHPLIDYFELPCTLIQPQEPNRLCKHYSYPNYTKNSTILNSSQLASTPNFYKKEELVDKLSKYAEMKPTTMTEVGQEYKFTPKSNGKHMLVINYHHFDLVDDTTLQGDQALNKIDLKVKKLTNNEPELPAPESGRILDENKDSIKVDPIKNRTLYEKFLRNFVEYKISNEEPVTADLTKCIYSFSCRQVIKTLEDDIAIFELSKQEEYQLSIKPNENSTAKLPAIIDLALLPIDDWSFDYVKGDLVCSRNASGFCIPNEFVDNENENRLKFIDRSEDILVEVPKDNVYKIDENNMIDLSQSNFLNSNQLTTIASGNVSEPKLYTFLVEYYQPNHASYDIQSNIILNVGTKKEVFVPSKIPVKYCPNVSGCKTQIVTTTNGTLFELTDSFDLTVAFPPDKSVYIKKINVISNENFSNNLLNSQPLHSPQVDFLKECANDAYYVNTTLYNQYWNQTSNSLIKNEDNSQDEDSKKVSKFCRDTIFGLAIKFNRGAVACNCDQRGSTSYDCAHFGGQCKCKPNIIGRTCNQCKVGFYGFPNCKACNCPSFAYCEPKTGRCVCPPRVTGAKCDTCVDLTFGYHHLNGCEECRCHSSGVLNGNLQCHRDTGACECKKNIAGRRCNQCVNGFYSFPQCTLCSCDTRGATEQICDSNSGKCFCKLNTYGEQCDQCKSDSFFLEESNPLGCLKCWCSGISNKCRSSDYVYIKHLDMLNKMGSRLELKDIQDRKNNTNSLILNNDGWTATKLIFVTEKSFNDYALNSISKANDTFITDNDSTTTLSLDENKVTANLPESEQREININQDLKQSINVIYGYYFRLPSSYLGTKITSYGGQLSYTVSNLIQNNYEGIFTGPDIIFVGNNITVIHEVLEQPPSPNDEFLVNVTLTEKSFKQLNGQQVSREKFLQMLLNVTSIYLKGVYFKYAKEFSLKNVGLDVGSNDPLFKNELSNYAKSVESCFCPKGYKGTSCEQCAPGYYRTKVEGKGLSYCIPCKCNGHSTECDVNTGVCFNCLHNTTGDHCNKCVTGYYGDASRGSPLDCMICPCPLAQESNNFALSCELKTFNSGSGKNALTDTLMDTSLSSQFTCKCKEGYTGPICAQCDTGYYGQPFVSGDYCKKCECSGNADLSVPGACDTMTGRCLLCNNNTYGDHCQICQPNYFGDAVNAKNCKKCSCSRCGTTRCDNSSGICECKNNVIGEHCSECDSNHWGFESCNGCKPCNCGIGSNSTQCDLQTGTCLCKPGVTGTLCDRCLPGFFNLTSEGCTDCNCTKKYSLGSVCDVKGQCHCMPGVIGQNCDGCPKRWQFIVGVGCQPCSSCVHGLLDFTDELKKLLDDVMNDMGDSSSTMLANRKLNRVNETVVSFKNRLAKLFDQKTEGNQTKNSVEFLRSLQRDGNDLESLSKKLIDLKQSLIDQTKLMLNDTRNSSIKIVQLYNAFFKTKEKLTKEIQWVKSLATTLIPAKIVNEESIVQKGEIIMNQLKQIDLSDNLKYAYEHLNASDELTERIYQFQEPWLKVQSEIEDIKKKINRFNDLILDFNKWVEEANTNSVRLEQNYIGLTNTYKEILVANKKLNDLNGTIDNLLQKAKEQNEKSKKVLDESLNNLNIEGQYEELLGKYDEMKDRNIKLTDEMEKLQNLVVRALTNVDNVNINATKIVDSFKDTKSYSLESVKAANSYFKMKEAIEESESLVKQAEDIYLEASQISNTGNKTERSKVDSYNLKTSAMNNQVKINNNLGVALNATKNRLDDLNFKLNSFLSTQRSIRDHTIDLTKLELEARARKIARLSDSSIMLSLSHKNKIDEREKMLLNQLEQTNEFDGALKNGSSALKGILAFHKAIDSTLPNLLSEVQKSPEKLERIIEKQSKLDEQLNTAKKNIRAARAIANRIDLGLEVKPNTYVELRPPINLLKPGTYTKLSLYFLPKVSNGLIAYLGNPKSIRSAAHSDQYQKPLLNDYLALELREKRVALIMDVGNEPLVVFHDQQVELNKWHFVEVEVIGKHVQLKLRSPDQQDKIITAHLEGTYTVFNIDRLNSKFYIGGIPKTIELQDKIENTDFDGEILQVTLGDSKLGLWSFVSGRNNNRSFHNKEAAFKSTFNANENSVKFNGKAYAQLDGQGHDLRRETNLVWQFKTLSNEGLMFLVGGDTMHFSVEVDQGRLAVRMDLESGSATIRSKEFVNDGNWHQLEVSRLEKDILVKLDRKEVELRTVEGRDLYLETDGQIYFGGYPNGGHPYAQVTKSGFNGCLRDIQIGSKLVKLDKDDKNLSPGVEFGCTENVVRELSFEKPGFITLPLKHEINQISFKFKTKEQNGLLFFVSNKDQSQFLAIYLNRGILTFQSMPGETISSSTHTERQFNDNNWHYLTATRTQNIMRLDLDDKYSYQPERQQQRTNKPVQYEPITNLNELAYFGGVDDEIKDRLTNSLDIPTQFLGCLGDLNLNEEFKNFAFSRYKNNVQLISCQKEINENELNEETTAPDYQPTASTPIEEEEFSLDPRKATTVSTTSTTTTTEEPDIPGKKHRPIRGCKLPVKPNEPRLAESINGLKYGARHTSRTEIKLEDSKLKEIEKDAKIEFSFSSSTGEGLLLLLVDNKFIDHTLVYLNGSRLYCSLNLGSGILVVNGEDEIKTKEWHKVLIIRESKDIMIYVDGIEIIKSSTPGDKTSLNVNPTLYVGGLSNDLIDLLSAKTARDSYAPFEGCINDIKLNSDLQILDLEDSLDGVESCNPVESTEEGIFFKGNGYLQYEDQFVIGGQIKLMIELKSRSKNGVILYARSSNSSLRDFLLVELVDGKIKTTVNNGGQNNIVAIVNLPSTDESCDGNWQTIQVYKVANMLIVDLGDHSSGPAMLTQPENADTNSDTDVLYIGGFPADLRTKKAYLENASNYNGCIRSLKITIKSKNQSEDTNIDLSKTTKFGNIGQEAGCPTT